MDQEHRNVAIRLGDLPITHRVAALILQHHLNYTYREILRAIADCQVIRICPCFCPVTHCATFYFEPPDPVFLPIERAAWLSTPMGGHLLLTAKPAWVKVEPLDYPDFPNKEELHIALRLGAPTATPDSAARARAAIREWLRGCRNEPTEKFVVKQCRRAPRRKTPSE